MTGVWYAAASVTPTGHIPPQGNMLPYSQAGRPGGGGGAPTHPGDHWAGGWDNFFSLRGKIPGNQVSPASEGQFTASRGEVQRPRQGLRRATGQTPSVTKRWGGPRSPSPEQNGKGFGKGRGEGSSEIGQPRSPAPHPATAEGQLPREPGSTITADPGNFPSFNLTIFLELNANRCQ